MIYILSTRKGHYTEDLKCVYGGLNKLVNAFLGAEYMAYDTETNITKDLTLREFYYIQIGIGDDQWIFDYNYLTINHRKVLFKILKSDIKKLAHNALFDLTLILYHTGILITNTIDTYIASQMLTLGLDKIGGYHSLRGNADRELDMVMLKDEQDKFDGSVLTKEAATYGAVDVAVLEPLWLELKPQLENYGLLSRFWDIECKFVRCLAQSQNVNFDLDLPMWQLNIDRQQTIVDDSRQSLTESVMTDPNWVEHCRSLNLIQAEDTYSIKWRSVLDKMNIIKLFYPDYPLSKTGQKELKQLVKSGYDNHPKLIMTQISKSKYGSVEDILINEHEDYLIAKGMLVKEGTVNINYQSTDQVKKLLHYKYPSLTSVAKDVLAKISDTDQFIRDYGRQVKASKLLSSYGVNFINAVNSDGMLRPPDYKQLLKTGRCGMKLFQLLPGQECYRSPFFLNLGKKMVTVGADYASQEYLVSGTFSDEEAIMDTVRNGGDLHSKGAALLFPKEWDELGGDPEPKGKPTDPGLLKFRNLAKSAIFAIFYGSSSVGLADTFGLFIGIQDLMDNFPDDVEKFVEENDLHLSKKSVIKTRLKESHFAGEWLSDQITGDDLIRKFKSAFPKTNIFLENGAEKAKVDFYLNTPGKYSIIRFFEPTRNDYELSAIHRQAMNLPIQGASATMTKLAAILMQEYIEDNGYVGKIFFLLPIHDELIYGCLYELAEFTSKLLKEKMELAAEIICGHTLLKADPAINWEGRWQK